MTTQTAPASVLPAIPEPAPKLAALKTEIGPVESKVRTWLALPSLDDASYQVGGLLLKEVATRRKAAEESRLSITRPIDAAKSAVMDLFRPFVEGLKSTEDQVKGKMIGYETELRRKAEAEAKAKREAELAAAQEAARKAAEEATAAADPNAAIEAQWAAEEAVAEAAKIEAAPLEVAPVSTVGFSTRAVKEPVVTDLRALCKAISEAPEGSPLLGLVKPDMPAIKAALKLGIAVAGVEIHEKRVGVAG